MLISTVNAYLNLPAWAQPEYFPKGERPRKLIANSGVQDIRRF
jgi:hypothetical protein